MCCNKTCNVFWEKKLIGTLENCLVTGCYQNCCPYASDAPYIVINSNNPLIGKKYSICADGDLYNGYCENNCLCHKCTWKERKIIVKNE